MNRFQVKLIGINYSFFFSKYNLNRDYQSLIKFKGYNDYLITKP